MRGVCKRFGATVALEDVDLSVAGGEVHALVGENGAGKSTLMKILAGSVQPDAGSLELDGKPYRPRDTLEGRRAGVAMIYQELALAPHLTVEQNIVLGMEPRRFGWIRRGEVRARARRALGFFDSPELTPGARVGRLSVAAQQLVEIGRAIAIGCRVLVLDEPTSSLARDDAEKLFRLIARLKQEGHAIIYISHFIEEVKRVADRVSVLRDGRCVASRAAEALDAAQIVAAMVGREVRELYPRSAGRAGEPVLTLDAVCGRRKPVAASLTLHRGEVLGIAGLVGAGRTELLRAVFGLDPVTRGAVRVGAWSGAATPARRLAQGVGMLSEDRKREGLALRMDIADNMTLSRLRGLGPAGLIAPRRQERAARRWIDRLQIRCQGPRQMVQRLSGGNQQKGALARRLHHDVDVWLLDEPTRGIDVASKAEIYRCLDELARGPAAEGRAPKALLVVSSYLPELLGICDRIAVMCRGRLGEARLVAEWTEHALMAEATGA